MSFPFFKDQRINLASQFLVFQLGQVSSRTSLSSKNKFSAARQKKFGGGALQCTTAKNNKAKTFMMSVPTRPTNLFCAFVGV